MSSPMSGSTSLRSPALAAVTPSTNSGSAWDLVASTTAWISSSVMKAPCMRSGLLAPIGRNRPSPIPMSFSAPGWSRMTRLSVSDEVANASRDGTLVLIRPVTTSTDGRWVASTRWMPAARAFCVMRTMASSTSRGAVIIRSASSSTMARMYG
ncbi:hypothetical protein DE4586_04696 [Mycobacteroides salmoniphilum]|nr:hypothetical protein DE4586_04696 [Mycobacteroides salmoniphilum]